MICPKCSASIPDDSRFCCQCGKRLAKTETRPRTKSRGNGTGMAYKRGKTWTARVTIGWKYEDDRKIQVYRTKGGFKTKTEAENYCGELKADPAAPKPSETIDQIYQRWQKEYDGRIAPVTMATYKAAWKKFAKVHPYHLQDITVSMLQACIDSCDKGRSTLNDMRTVCSLVYKYAIINGLTDKNLAQHLYVNTKKKGTRPAFTADELDAIRKAIPSHPFANYVYCMCYLGFRPNEMLTLKKTAYDPDHTTLTGGFKTEAGRDRIVPVSPKIRPIIDAQLRTPGDYLFPDADGQLMTDDHFRKYCFNPLMAALGIDGKVPYSCRHTFANLLKNVPGSDTDKAALIGHADASMTKYYQSPDYKSLSAIIDAL